MTYMLAVCCAFPLALSHDLGGPLGLVALAPLMALSLRVERAFSHGFVCGFAEVFLTMWGASNYTFLIPITLALQAGLVRGVLAWSVAHRRGPILPISLLVIGQGLRTTSVLTLPLSCGHDLVSVWWLSWPAAWGGGALLTAICGLTAYALVLPVWRKAIGVGLVTVMVISVVHESFRPSQGPEIAVKASVIQGGLPNWVYRQAAVDPQAEALIRDRYLAVAQNQPPERLLILPETAVRETWGQGTMTDTYRALHERGHGLVVGVNHRIDGALRNTAMVWRPGASEPEFQTKQTVVPIVEREFEAMSAEVAKLPLGGRVQLCIESVYPRYSDPQANWLLVLTNDAGVGRSAPRRAFERESRLRAVETGRSLIRAGQDGLSYLVAPNGRLLKQLAPYQAGVLTIDQIPGPLWSMRGALGDWFFWVCLLVAIWAWFRRLRSHERDVSVP